MKNAVYVVGFVTICCATAHAHEQVGVPRENSPLVRQVQQQYLALAVNDNHPIEDVVVHQSSRCLRVTMSNQCSIRMALMPAALAFIIIYRLWYAPLIV